MSSAKIIPYGINGLNTVGRVTGTKEDLKDAEFLTACPPDVPPRSRVVAVCGITDHDNDASPAESGFFFSDFYLFHHLLRPGMGVTPRQIWITSEEPRELVGKYKEYVHGDPKNGRRVVLNEDLLSDVEQSGTIRVVQRDQLLERFVSVVREQSSLALDADEHLIILIFGHGQFEPYGVHLGYNGPHEPVLHINDIKRALKPNNKVTFFSAACFSGGWLVQPNVNRKQHINTTGIVAADRENEALSWPVSASLNRACGSIVAGSILQALVDLEQSPDSSQVLQDPTYISLANSIYAAYSRLNPYYPYDQGIHFSAKDDTWETHYEQRVGIPLSRFRERFESLPSVPDGAYQPSPDLSHFRVPVARLGTIKKRSKVKSLAYTYMKSHPGITEMGPNLRLHNKIYQLFDSKEKLSDEKIDWMCRNLEYRLNSMDQANYLAALMGVRKTDIRDFIVEGCVLTPKQKDLRSLCYKLIFEKKLLDKPGNHSDLVYTKPIHYLAISLALSGMTYEEIQEKIVYAATVVSSAMMKVTVGMAVGMEAGDESDTRKRKEKGHNKKLVIPY